MMSNLRNLFMYLLNIYLTVFIIQTYAIQASKDDVNSSHVLFRKANKTLSMEFDQHRNSSERYDLNSEKYSRLNTLARSSYDLGKRETPYAPIVSSCTSFIIDFSDAASAFTKCSILFSRPLRFCERCVEEYMIARESFYIIMQGEFHDERGLRCSDAILHSDRVQILVQTFNFMEKVWSDCFCDDCFEYKLNSTEFLFNNKTAKFFRLSNATNECFENYTDVLNLPFTNITVKSAVCKECEVLYAEMNAYYDDLVVNAANGVCMDIADIMNSTRLMWSGQFGCNQNRPDILPVVLLSVFFCCLPILFYVTNAIQGKKKRTKILIQKRLRESQVNPSTSDAS